MRITGSRLYFLWCGILLLGIVFSIIGYEYADEEEFAAIPGNQPTTAPVGQVSLVVKVNERLLEVYQDEQFYKKYRIAVGKSGTPTPIGEWRVVWKDYNWGTGFGTRWMGLNVPWSTFIVEYMNECSQTQYSCG